MSGIGLGLLETGILEAVAIFGITPRSIGGIKLDVTIQETGIDEMTVTEHPVEQSAAISDHAFKKPARVVIRAGATNSHDVLGSALGNLLQGGSVGSAISGAFNSASVIDIYKKLLALQASAKLFTVITGKRSYDNMLMVSLVQETDKRSENALMVTCAFQELILVQTSVTPVGVPAAQADPASTQDVTNTGTQVLGPAPNFNPAAAGDFAPS